jgi:alkanesulfonate monooxygenase SsuD/methylene tetrahydromethanopterin reductase-like flavin-dependent oxidoreductase (luciferase family)
MKISVFLGSHFEPSEDASTGVRQMTEQARLAEEVGFDSVFLGHHYLARSQFLQPIATAGYIAATTERIGIGFGVLLAPLFNPLELAEELATLDALSNGRLIAGLGIGYRRIETDAFGVEWTDRIARLRQYVPILRALWRGEAVTAEGSFGKLNEARVLLRPVQEGGPPIWIGAFVDRAIRRAAELDAPWFMPPNGSDEDLARWLDLYRTELQAKGQGLERAYPLNREGAVAKTREQAIERVKPYLVAQYKGYKSWDSAQAMDLDEFVREHCLIGSPEWVAERIDRLKREFGITEVVLRLQYMGMSHEQTLEAISEFGSTVLPLLGARSPGA